MMKRLYIRLANRLIIKLAGNRQVLINARIDGHRGVILSGDNGLVVNVNISNFKTGSGLTVVTDEKPAAGRI